MENSKILTYSVLALGLGVFGFSLFATNKPKANRYLDASPALPDGSVFNAKKIAETLYDAMKGINITNDAKNEAIFAALTGVTQDQFGKVFAAFGSKRYNTYTGNTVGLYSYNLKTWLKSELSPVSYMQLQKQYPKYL